VRNSNYWEKKKEKKILFTTVEALVTSEAGREKGRRPFRLQRTKKGEGG